MVEKRRERECQRKEYERMVTGGSAKYLNVGFKYFTLLSHS